MVFRFATVSIFLAVLASAFLYTPLVIEEDVSIPQTAQVIELAENEKSKKIELVFVGDIMLGRHVERIMEEWGIMFPFQNIRSLISYSDLSIGNFEGIVSEEHVPAPSMTFAFSIRNEYLTHMRALGFDILSLANNHSFDYGSDALSHTRKICRELGLTCGGSPIEIDTYSTVVKEVEGTTFGFLFLHTVFGAPDEDELLRVLAMLKEESDIQIAYIHWGEEYILTHNAFQEALAIKLIDHGIDIVIGHHPHVVQDVALYNNKPIFYSLGNFIFDQYFSSHVEEGLAVKMEVAGDEITYSLIPVTSSIERTQPEFMDAKEALTMNERILKNVSNLSNVDVAMGTIIVPRD